MMVTQLTQNIDALHCWFNSPSPVHQNSNTVPLKRIPTHVNADNYDSAMYIADNHDSYIENNIHVISIGDYFWRDKNIDKICQEHGSAKSLLHAYIKYSEDLLKELYGHFCFVIYDKTNNIVISAIDRIGVKSLCYTLDHQNGLILATDLDLLCSHPNVSPSISNQAIYDYIYFHVIPSPETIYKNIYKLEPGQLLLYKNNTLELKHYWLPEFTNDNANIELLSSNLKQQLGDAVERCNSGSNTGAFLSGGLDSSTVAGLLSKIQNENKTKTFSIGFNQEGYDEIEYARAAVEKFNTIQHEYYVTPDDIADSIVTIAQAYDEPFGNSSAIPAYFCAKLAKQNGTDTLLAGDGGDELFAGNERYAKQKIFDIYDHIPTILKSSFIEPVFHNSAISKSISILQKVNSYISQAKIPMPDRTQSYNFMVRSSSQDIFSASFLADVNTDNPSLLLNECYHRTKDDNIVNKMLYLDWKFTLADNDLRKVNRMCQISGINVKYPMLDDELIQFSTTIPASLKLKGQKLRYFYKYTFNEFLPAKIVNKPKHGFGLPFGEWLKDSVKLQDIIYSSLTDLKKRNIFNDTFIDNLIATHKSDHASYYGTMLWVLAVLEIWLQKKRL